MKMAANDNDNDDDNEQENQASLFDCSLSFLTDELCRLTDDDLDKTERPTLCNPFLEYDYDDKYFFINPQVNENRNVEKAKSQEVNSKKFVTTTPENQSESTSLFRTFTLLQQRGEKIDTLGEKAGKLNDGAATYASLAKQLKEKMLEKQKKKKGFFALAR